MLKIAKKNSAITEARTKDLWVECKCFIFKQFSLTGFESDFQSGFLILSLSPPFCVNACCFRTCSQLIYRIYLHKRTELQQCSRLMRKPKEENTLNFKCSCDVLFEHQNF